MDSDTSIENIEENIASWYPRDILRRTNWLYRVDALRPHDIREMSIMWELAELFQGYATQYIIWAYIICSIISSSTNNQYVEKLEGVVKLIAKMVEILWYEWYYCF